MFCGPPLAAIAFLAATSVMDVPDPRPSHQVVDLTGTLTSDDIGEIDRAAQKVAAHGELVVVVVPTTDGANPRQWATAYFNRLRVDHTRRNRGVLLMAAINDRKAEIVIGDGFPGDVTAVTDRIMASVIVARFKSGDARGALVQGAGQLAEQVVGASAAAADGALLSEAAAPVAASDLAETQRRVEQVAAEERRAAAWRAQAAAQQAEAEQRKVKPFFDDDNPVAWGVGGAGLFGLFFVGREVLRRRPRSCKSCNVPMHRLAEELDDQHLKEGERAEERLGSVDYDIWACTLCGDVLKTRWGAIFTSYSKCSGCSWKTMTSKSRTIRAATTSSTGLAEVTDDCKHCSHHRTYTRVIPRVTKSSSSSSSSSSSRGGGSSSGRGSSGSW